MNLTHGQQGAGELALGLAPLPRLTLSIQWGGGGGQQMPVAGGVCHGTECLCGVVESSGNGWW